jgi:hypothetical protein
VVFELFDIVLKSVKPACFDMFIAWEVGRGGV